VARHWAQQFRQPVPEVAEDLITASGGKQQPERLDRRFPFKNWMRGLLPS
jgi:hypothetical protein